MVSSRVAQVPSASMPFEVGAFLFWGLLVGVPLGSLVMAMGVKMHGDLASLAALPTDAPRGPVLTEGTLSRPSETVRSYAGAEVIGWVSEVRTVIGTGKSKSHATLCSNAHLDGMRLTLRDGRTSLALQLPDYHVSEGLTDMLTSVTQRNRPARLVRGAFVSQPEIPAAMTAACELAPLREHETRTYVEHRFLSGARYTFVGCRDGDALVQCTDGSGLAGHLLPGSRNDLLGDLTLAAVAGVVNGLLTLWAMVAWVTVPFGGG